MINLNRRAYLKARKNDKPAISRSIVKAIRRAGGRFLKKDEKSGLYYEIGDDAAREKTSQALRQRAPEMRKLLFDTERAEAKVAVEEHMRQQRLMMGLPPDLQPPGVQHPGQAVAAAFNPTFFQVGAGHKGAGSPAVNPGAYQQFLAAMNMNAVAQQLAAPQRQQPTSNAGSGAAPAAASGSSGTAQQESV